MSSFLRRWWTRLARVDRGVQKATGWTIARQAILLLLAVMALLQYIYMDLLVEIASMPSITVIAPAVGS